jgi:hypothetical protein
MSYDPKYDPSEQKLIELNQMVMQFKNLQSQVESLPGNAYILNEAIMAKSRLDQEYATYQRYLQNPYIPEAQRDQYKRYLSFLERAMSNSSSTVGSSPSTAPMMSGGGPNVAPVYYSPSLRFQQFNVQRVYNPRTGRLVQVGGKAWRRMQSL